MKDQLPLWVKYIAAFGGIAAAATAVGIATWGALRDRRQRPRLELLYDHDHGEDFAVGLNDGSQHWVRLRVRNAPGRRSAEDVEVVVVGVERDEREAAGPITGFPFVWSNTLQPEGQPAARLAIPPGVTRRVDLLSVHQPVQVDGGGGATRVTAEGQHPAQAQLEINPRPRGESSLLNAGTHTIVVAITARDTDAAFYRIGVNFDGLWWGAEAIGDHLKVGQPVRTGETAF